MSTVTQRVKNVGQPRGGYVNKKIFKMIELSDGMELEPLENIHSILMGLVVEDLARFMWGFPKDKAFEISLMGADYLDWYNEMNIAKDNEYSAIEYAEELLSNIKDLDDLSIISACKMVGYDVCYRAGVPKYKPVENINPDKDTISNIRTMVQRCIDFNSNFGSITHIGFTFSKDAYTDLICAGDGDFLTKDTMWDLKVSKFSLYGNRRVNEWTLQLFVYYLLGCHSVDEYPEFGNIKKLGFYNPRLNEVYIADIDNIPRTVFQKVETEVIGYEQ